MSPLLAVVIVNCLSAAAFVGGAWALRRVASSRVSVVISGVLLGVAVEIVAATTAAFFPVSGWTWAAIKVTGRAVELALAVRFLLYLFEKMKNGGVR